MPPFKSCHSLIVFAISLVPASVLASPLAASELREAGLSRRGNPYHIHCGNAPGIVAGYPVASGDIVIPSVDEGPLPATTDSSGYFPYLWCGADTSTYVFIDPIGNYGYNKGTEEPIFWTGLDGAYNATQNAMAASAASNSNPSNGDGDIGGSQTFRIPVNDLAPAAGIASIEVFAESSNHQKLTWGTYAAALTIMKSFVLTYPLYADAIYFQIGDSHWSTVGNGYMGIVPQGSNKCYLKGTETQGNQVPCAMPRNYPDN